jgi:cytochrome P450
MDRAVDHSPPETAPDVESWRQSCVRRFRILLGIVAGLFIATELMALSGLVPRLQPVSLSELSANILFAIGFGCPLVLHISSVPGWKELLKTATAGALLAVMLRMVHHFTGVPPEYELKDVIASEWVIGLGIASLGVLSLRAWRCKGRERTAALLFLFPAGVALLYTLEAGIFLNCIKAVFTITADGDVYAADAAYGTQISFAVGRLFAQWPALKFICFAIYVAPPPALIFVYALQAKAQRPPPIDAVTVLLFLAVAGYSFYFLFPVCGPLFAFPDAFPWSPPPAEYYLGRAMEVTGKDAWPNGMPSLHLASVILAWWHAWPFGRWARATAAVFVVGTFLATLGLGEHYFVDLVVAVPFTLAVHAACTPRLPHLRQARRVALLGSLALVSLWYVILFFGIPILLSSTSLTWGITAATVFGTVALERHLAKATLPVQPKLAPSPPGNFLLGHLLPFRRDVLGLLLDSQRQYGDVVRFRLGPMIVHLLSHPDHVKHVLLTNQHNYNKDTRSSSKIRSITGPGLLTSNGDFWLAQRRLMQPAFQQQRVAGFLNIMIGATEAMLKRWQIHADQGKPVDIASEMMRLTYTVVGKALFGADVSTDIDRVEQAAAIVMAHVWRRLEKILDIPECIPISANLRFRRALATIDQIVYRIIQERYQSREQPGDLLSILLHRRDEETGKGMSDEQLRNETITLLLAGHETTANALTWTWYLLSQHPSVAQRLRDEVNDVLGSRLPTLEDLAKLSYTTMVIRESMRLYPPIWIMERRVLADDEINGFHMPAGSSVVLCPYVTHRHPEFWDNSEVFEPERFLPEGVAGRSPYAYIPFGAGQRLCIGNHFALMEAQVIVSMVSQMYRLDLVPGFSVQPKPGITLRTTHGLVMTLHSL